MSKEECHVYIVVDKNTGRFIRDTGTASHIDTEGLYNNLLNNIDKSTQQIIYVEDESPFIKTFYAMFDAGKEFKVEIENNQVVGVRLV